jgi:hypothetical protein
MPDRSVPHYGFESVPLPFFPPGADLGRMATVLNSWISSPPLRALAAASGWDWPDYPPAADLFARVAELSGDWDFRGRAERDLISAAPAVANGRIIAEDLIVAAATALGLVHAAPMCTADFTHLVVLSGLARSCVNRSQHAADLLRAGLRARSTVVLGGHRELPGQESEQARELGFGDLFDEADVALAATRQAFSLGEPKQTEESCAQLSSWDNSLQGASARYRWKDVEVVVAPSSKPEVRRADTADQLRWWANLARVSASDRVLLLTTQIYVPFQQLAGLRVLGLEHGCQVYCCGVSVENFAIPGNPFSGRSYLQEIRSALLAASGLMAAAQRVDG